MAGGGGTTDGDYFDPSDRAAMEGFATRTGVQLMLQVELGTGPDARYVCPTGTKDAPPVLPALRVSRQTDGINCEPSTAFRLEEQGVGRILVNFGNSIKDFPDKNVSLHRCQALGYEVFVYSQAKHRPRIVRRFCLNHDLAHRVPSSASPPADLRS